MTPTWYLVSSCYSNKPERASTRYLVSSWWLYGPKLDTWYRVEAQCSPNRSTWAAFRHKCSPTRYLVSSWAEFMPKCSLTRYQVLSWAILCTISILGIELRPVEASTQYLVSSLSPLTGLNSILGIELIPLRTWTRYQVSSWGPYGDQLDTWYRVEPFRGSTRY